MDLYKEFFAPGTRGHYYIRAFHHKNINRFRNTDLEDPDALIHQVFLGVKGIRPDRIDGPVEHYVIRAISYQCWRILEKEVHRRSVLSVERSVSEENDGSHIEHMALEPSSAEDRLAESDLMGQIILFRQTLKVRERKILNYLIDGDRPLEIAKKLKLTESSTHVIIHRIRRKLDLFLNKIDYSENMLKGSQASPHYKTKRTP